MKDQEVHDIMKKILSILLVAALAVGFFAIGVSAEANPLDSIVLLSAEANWPSAVRITNLESPWDQARINWAPFTAPAGQLGYLEQRSLRPDSVYARWTVEGIRTGTTNRVNFTPMIRSSINDVHSTDTLAIFAHSPSGTASAERLYISQNPGRPRWYGELIITLTIYAYTPLANSEFGARASRTSTELRISLISIDALRSTIEAAEDILARRSRYHPDFIRDLERATNNARWFLTADVSNSGPAVDAARLRVQRLVDQAENGDHYFLIFDWGFFNAIAPFIYGISDLFSRISDAAEPVMDFFRLTGSVFSFFFTIIRFFIPGL